MSTDGLSDNTNQLLEGVLAQALAAVASLKADDDANQAAIDKNDAIKQRIIQQITDEDTSKEAALKALQTLANLRAQQADDAKNKMRATYRDAETAQRELFDRQRQVQNALNGTGSLVPPTPVQDTPPPAAQPPAPTNQVPPPAEPNSTTSVEPSRFARVRARIERWGWIEWLFALLGALFGWFVWSALHHFWTTPYGWLNVILFVTTWIGFVLIDFGIGGFIGEKIADAIYERRQRQANQPS